MSPRKSPTMLRRRFSKPVLIAFAALLVLGSVIGLRAMQAKKEEKKDAKVVLEFTPADVAVVEVRRLESAIQFSGSLSPVVQTTVKTKVPGEVSRMLVREGESVAQGQLIAQIDTSDL